MATSEFQNKEGFCSKEGNYLYAVHFHPKVMQLTCFVSYLKPECVLAGLNHQQFVNKQLPRQHETL